MGKSAQDLIDEIEGKQVIVRQSSMLTMRRGIPLSVLKTLTPNQIKRLERQMKGGNK